MIEKTYRINATLHTVWQALVDPDMIEMWSGIEALMDPLPRTIFKLWGGDIFGRNREVIEEKKLVQEWFAGKWKKPSIVTIEISREGNATVIQLKHTGYPEEEHEKLEEGWDEYYFGAIKRLLEKK